MNGDSIKRWTDTKIGIPVVVSGPSGVGKTCLVDRLLAAESRVVRSISCTTRPIRKGETDGKSYSFLGEKTFLQMQADGGFAESARYSTAWYGTPKAPLERHLTDGQAVVMNIEVQGGLQLRDSYRDAVLVFVLPPTWEELERRLRSRKTDTEEQIQARISRAREELKEVDAYDYVIVNDSLDRCTSDLIGIVRAERRKVTRLRSSQPSDS